MVDQIKLLVIICQGAGPKAIMTGKRKLDSKKSFLGPGELLATGEIISAEEEDFKTKERMTGKKEERKKRGKKNFLS